MMTPADSTIALAARLAILERRLRRLQALLVGGALAFCTVAVVAFRTQPPQDAGIIYARRIVLTDSESKPGAAIELGHALVAVGSGDRFQESKGGQALVISIADNEAGGFTDSTEVTGAEMRLSPRLFTVMFGGWVAPGRSLNPDQGSGMALSAKPALGLTSRGTMLLRVDPGSRYYRPVSGGPASP
jgi:hypothetical protein